jgi:hypothetical protein
MGNRSFKNLAAAIRVPAYLKIEIILFRSALVLSCLLLSSFQILVIEEGVIFLSPHHSRKGPDRHVKIPDP